MKDLKQKTIKFVKENKREIVIGAASSAATVGGVIVAKKVFGVGELPGKHQLILTKDAVEHLKNSGTIAFDIEGVKHLLRTEQAWRSRMEHVAAFAGEAIK